MTLLQPGQMLGPYQIISQIGKGGMATVYKAYHASMDRYVALKVVATQLSDEPSFLQRFRQEARLIAKLEHPHILPVHDFGEADGIPYMVMRFLDSGTLKERLSAGALSLQETDHIFSQLADALEYAHENGVVHRDIKPSNAMLDKRGGVFLTDFGVAKMIEGAAGLTATGAVTGTPSYMSPEQAQGNKVDQRSDIYSLGVVLFEMLTGRVPFEAETPMAVLFKQIQDPPPPLSIVRPDLPYTLEGVLLKALAKNPADRYASMHAFRDGWKHAITEASVLPAAIPAPPAPPTATETVLPAGTISPTLAAPAPKRSSWKLLAIGIPVCALIFCLSLAFVFRERLANPLRGIANLPDATQPSRSAPAETSVTPQGIYTSWTGANTVYSIAFRDDEILAGGPGGITVWNRADGSHRRFTTMDGLPSANVGAIFVDNDRSIWVGTDAGLAHINGDERTTYTTAQGLDNDYIVAIARAGERLFAGSQYSGATGGGLLEFNGRTWEQVSGFPSSDNPDAESVSYNVRQIVADEGENLWVATDQGIAMLDGDSQWNVFKTESGLPDNGVRAIYPDRNGNIWAGISNGSVAKFNWDDWAFESVANLNDLGIYDVCCILEDPDGILWFAGGNVARYNPEEDEWTGVSVDGSLPLYSVLSAGIDDQGTLYFGMSESGLARYADGEYKIALVPNTPRYAQYGRIVPAPDGKIFFIPLYQDNADVFNPADESWAKNPPEQHSPRAFDADGNMWSGGWDGLWIFSGAKTTQVTTEHGLPSNQVNGIVFDSAGMAYIATDAGIAVFDGLNVTEVYTAAGNGLISDDAYFLFMGSDGSLWASVEGGFSRRLPDGTWEHFTAEKLFGGSAFYFLDFVEDTSGNIWVTTDGDGVYLFSNNEWKRLRSLDPGVGLPSDYTSGVALAPDGTLWFGSNGQGAVRYDGQTWQTYRASDGLIDDHVNDIHVDANGTVWFTTNGGISRLQP